MTITTNVYFIIVAAVALVEIGANVALIEAFYAGRGRWRYPITTKMLAVSLLLAYVALSVMLGNPAPWRVSFAAAAVIADGVAIYRLWDALRCGRPLA